MSSQRVYRTYLHVYLISWYTVYTYMCTVLDEPKTFVVFASTISLRASLPKNTMHGYGCVRSTRLSYHLANLRE
jgi:hypothetical protein